HHRCVHLYRVSYRRIARGRNPHLDGALCIGRCVHQHVYGDPGGDTQQQKATLTRSHDYNENRLEIVNPHRNCPLVHEEVVTGMYCISWMAVALVKLRLKIRPPVSISRPMPNGL